MSVFLPSCGVFLILLLGASGNFGSPEDNDMDLFGRSWDPEDFEDNIDMSKRASINIGKIRDFGRSLKKTRQQQFLLSQQEKQLRKLKSNIEIKHIQALSNTEGGLSFGRG